MKMMDRLVLGACCALDKTAWLTLWARFAVSYGAGSFEMRHPEIAAKAARAAPDFGAIDESKLRNSYCAGIEARLMARARRLSPQALYEWTDGFMSKAEADTGNADGRWVWHLLATGALHQNNLPAGRHEELCLRAGALMAESANSIRNADNYYIMQHDFDYGSAAGSMKSLAEASRLSGSIRAQPLAAAEPNKVRL